MIKIFENKVAKLIKGDFVSYQVTKKSFKIFVIQGVGLGLTFIVNFWIAKLLNTQGYGYYSYITTVVNLLSTIACLGFSSILVRELSVYYSEGKRGEMLGLIKFAFGITLAISILFAIFFFISSKLNLLPWVLSSWITASIAFIIPISSILLIRQFIFNGLNKSAESQFGNYILKPSLTLLFIVISLFILKYNFSNELSAFIYILSILFTYVIIEFTFRKYLNIQFNNAKTIFHYNNWIKISSMMLAYKIIDALYLNSEILFLSYLKGENEVGIFSMAKKLSNLISFGMMAFHVVLTPKIAVLIHENKLNELQSIITKNLRIILSVSISITLLILLFSKHLFNYLGTDFNNCFLPLLILSIGELINVAFGPVIPLLINSKQEKFATLILGISFLLSILLNLLLTKTFGYIGAAITTVLTTFCWNFIMAWKIKRTTGIKSWIN